MSELSLQPSSSSRQPENSNISVGTAVFIEYPPLWFETTMASGVSYDDGTRQVLVFHHNKVREDRHFLFFEVS